MFTGTLHFRSSHFVIDGQTRHADWRSGYGFTIDDSQAGGSYGVEVGIPFELAVSDITMRYVEIRGTGDRTDLYNDRGFITAGILERDDLVVVHPPPGIAGLSNAAAPRRLLLHSPSR